MKKILIGLIAFSACLILLSCKKNISGISDNLDAGAKAAIAQAHAWADSSVDGKNIQALTFKNGSDLQHVSLNWTQATSWRSGEHTFVEVPMLTLGKKLSDGAYERRINLMIQFSDNKAIAVRIKQSVHDLSTLTNKGVSLGATTMVVFDNVSATSRTAFLYTANTKQYTQVYLKTGSAGTSAGTAAMSASTARKSFNAESCTEITTPIYSLTCTTEQQGTDYNAICTYELDGYTNVSFCYQTGATTIVPDGFNYTGATAGPVPPPSSGFGDLGLENEPVCPGSFYFRYETAGSFIADLWGIRFALYTDPNYPGFDVSKDVTFGLSITMPSDITFMPSVVKASIEGYVGSNVLYTGPLLADLKITKVGNTDHLLVSPRAMALIAARAMYESAYKIKMNGRIQQLDLPHGADLVKNDTRNYFQEELDDVIPGSRVQKLNTNPPGGNSRNLVLATMNPFTGQWQCPQ